MSIAQQKIPVKHKPRVVSQATAARLLGVARSTICAYLDKGFLEPWFAPDMGTGKRRRMIVAASIDRFIERGVV